MELKIYVETYSTFSKWIKYDNVIEVSIVSINQNLYDSLYQFDVTIYTEGVFLAII